MEERVGVALGASLGDVEQTLEASVAMLAKLPGTRVAARSRWHQTNPVGPSTRRYLNGAVLLDSQLSPGELLAQLHAIETQLGRTRASRWDDRTLDLDLLFHGNHVEHTSTLRLPHPAYFYRRFVLDPLVEIAPDWVDPERGLSVAALRERILSRPLRVALVGHDSGQVQERVAAEFPEVDLSAHGTVTVDGLGAVPPLLAIGLDGTEPPPGERAAWLDLWGHLTTVPAGPRTLDEAVERVREVLHSALGR